MAYTHTQNWLFRGVSCLIRELLTSNSRSLLILRSILLCFPQDSLRQSQHLMPLEELAHSRNTKEGL